MTSEACLDLYYLHVCKVKVQGKGDVKKIVCFFFIEKKKKEKKAAFAQVKTCAETLFLGSVAKVLSALPPLTLVLLNLDMSFLCKQCRSRSVGF